MRVVLELFLTDNLLMNALILRAAEAISGGVKRRFGFPAASALGSAYAFAALALGGFWLSMPAKLFTSCAMIFVAFRMKDWRQAGRAAIGFYAATFVIGGMCYALVSLLGGYANGFILGISAPVRALLLGAALAAFLPGWLRAFLARRKSAKSARLRISAQDTAIELDALLDTGSALVEPFSGRPVMLISPDKGISIHEHTPGATPVPYASISGKGLLFAVKAQKIEAFEQGRWRDAPVLFVAVAPAALVQTDAVVSETWWQSFN